jgi:hypothetical protein
VLLVQDSFLNESCAQFFHSSALIFVNNHRHWDELGKKQKRSTSINFELSKIYQKLPEGTIIVSSNKFVNETKPISEHNRGDISSIIRYRLLFEGICSWTGTPVLFHSHTVDRSRLEAFKRQRQIDESATRNNPKRKKK